MIYCYKEGKAMKLKNLLVLAFLLLTFIPTSISLFLLYQSGLNLSKESYTRNLEESITVQADYISQTIENNMISDNRFANKVLTLPPGSNFTEYIQDEKLFTAFQSYLESSEDKITISILMDSSGTPLYTIGEKNVLDTVMTQLPDLSDSKKQKITEFVLSDNTYSLGIITPVHDSSDIYLGSLISIYDESYIFKIISSYYEIADASTYICRNNGEIISFRGPSTESRNASVENALSKVDFSKYGVINTPIDSEQISGYYKNIYMSPWYLVGFIDHSLLYSFTNKFVLAYMVIIAVVLILGIALAYLFSRKVVAPINHLIKMMDSYQTNITGNELPPLQKNGYYETQYLQTKFLDLMKRILLVQHNFQGIYQLYESNNMGDTNIEIDVMNQTAHSNKEAFQDLMDQLVLPPEACVVERFTNCFCKKDQQILMDMFVNMRDEHLSITSETEIYTPYLGEKWFHSLVVPMYDQKRLSKLFVQLRDVTNFKKQELESSEKARKDPLTELNNRSGFLSAVNSILQNKENPLASHGLLFIDMDYFKLVNDNFGHSEGDRLLCAISSTLLSTIRPTDIASRFGGDEFAIFLPYTTPEATESVKAALSKALIYPYQTKDGAFVVSASIGVSIWSHSDPHSLENLIHLADTSMYQSKRNFKKS